MFTSIYPSSLISQVSEDTTPIYDLSDRGKLDIIASGQLKNSLLADLSPSDCSWDGHRSQASKVENYYRSFANYQGYAERMSVCSLFLDFKLVPADEVLKLKLSTASFCRVRFCPVCQWRRSLMWHSKALKILPSVLEAYPTYRWLMLTLTIKNVPITDLRATLTHLNKSFERLSQLKYFPAEGWLKCSEVTRNARTNEAHPHFHILMMVKPSYFGVNYLSFDKWRSMWRKSARLDYDPEIEVKTFKDTDADLFGVISEVIKYQVKESDLTANRDWFLELSQQLHKTRAISTGGILKNYFKQLENEPDDLIGKGDEDEETVGHLYFAWMAYMNQYQLRD